MVTQNLSCCCFHSLLAKWSSSQGQQKLINLAKDNKTRNILFVVVLYTIYVVVSVTHICNMLHYQNTYIYCVWCDSCSHLCASFNNYKMIIVNCQTTSVDDNSYSLFSVNIYPIILPLFHLKMCWNLQKYFIVSWTYCSCNKRMNCSFSN